ncbi:MAG: exopolysaccharide Pel transporter PelG, partial [Planctomycetota bacterium]
MAGIGFELRRILDRDSYLDTVRAYGYAGVIGSGPWVLSIVGVTLVGLLCVGRDHGRLLSEYWSCVTYVIAGSLILTGFLQ